jgi:hypothetical protein
MFSFHTILHKRVFRAFKWGLSVDFDGRTGEEDVVRRELASGGGSCIDCVILLING